MIRIKVEGIEQIKQRYSVREINKKLIPVMEQAADTIHKKLKNSISQTYFAPYTLDKVYLGNKVRPVRSDRKSVSFDLIYENKAIPLVDFPYKETSLSLGVNSESGFFYRLNANKTSFRYKKKLNVDFTEVKIKRSGSFKSVFGSFYKDRDTSGWDSYTLLSKPIRLRKGIYRRISDDTWISRPFKREKLQLLFGPSLAQMANSRMQNSRAVNEFRRSFIQTVEEKFNL